MGFLWFLSQNDLRLRKRGNYGMLFIKGKRYVIKGNWDAIYCFAFKEEGALSMKGFCPVISWEHLQNSG